MAWDIHGNPLKRGHCEVHPWVAEEYPCSLCEIEDQKREFQREREVFQDRAQKDIWNDYVSPLQARIKELEQQLETFERAERIDANSFEERCSEASHYAWLDDEYQAALERIKELEASQSKWVSVKERLPIDGSALDKHLVTLSDGCILIGRLYSDGWTAFFMDGESKVFEREVTHWQPLPSKPEN